MHSICKTVYTILFIFVHLCFRLRMERQKQELNEPYHEEQESKLLRTTMYRSLSDIMEVDYVPPLINLLQPNGTLQVPPSALKIQL